MHQRVLATAALIASLGAGAGIASAQDTRADLLEQKRAQKAGSLQTYEPGKLEKAVLWYEQHDPLGRLSPHNGFYAQYGFQWKPVGSGVGVGAGFRHDLFDRIARVDLGGGITFRNYQMLQADFSLPYLADERVELGVHVVYNHNPQEDYWGLGPDSLEDNRVSFTADYTDFQARAVARPVSWIEAGARFGKVQGSLDSGTDSRFPSIEELFTDASAPGLAEQPDFSYGEVLAAIDYRDQEDNARAGGYYAVRWRKYNDLDLDRYSFREIDAHVMQFFPIFDKKRVIAVQARLISTTPDEGHVVPFYFRPTLGGSTSMRGYNDYRFRDDHVAYLNLEYRWEVFSGLDMALFSDWGTVAPTFEDLSASNLKKGYGIGFRFNTYKSVWWRIDFGFGGDEGVQYFFKFSKAF
jgi:outer membrane protein assembly factor BamA